MKFLKTFFGDLIRVAVLFHLFHLRDTVVEAVGLAFDTIAGSQTYASAKALSVELWNCFCRRLRLAIWLALGGLVAGVLIGAVGYFGGIGYFVPKLSKWTANIGFLAYAIPFMMASAIVLWELLKGQVAKQAIAAILIVIHHGGSKLKQLLPQLIVGNWDADPILKDVEYLATRVINTLWTIFIGINTAVLFTLITGIFTNPLAFVATAIACILATAWAIRYSKDEKILKWASATVIVCTLIGAAGWSLWGLYTRSETYLEGVKPEAVARFIAGKETESDRWLLGTEAVRDLVSIRALRGQDALSGCDAKKVDALKKRVNGTLSGDPVAVSIPNCEAEQAAKAAKAAAAEAAKKAPEITDAQKKVKERQEAMDRVLAGKQKPGDKAILDGVYSHAISYRTLRASTYLNPCWQKRTNELKARLDAFVRGEDYTKLPLSLCEPMPSRPKPSDVDDALSQAARDIRKKFGD